ncbi:hypothetical protein NE237_027077 [Protea cynaroides]|uniref:FMN hydroxy acid dehydrogenase domain-containing protein n=1 Tax=Protea cynaroides TaxID=273540 RepID=A0A9Q0GPS8_9MAGN|nr:hypothetical protein NE237_027077 [Protea cynaroides]
MHLTREKWQLNLLMFQPRVLVDVSRINISTTILGYSILAPIIVAPTAMYKLANPEGELASARAAAACNTIMVLSSMSICTMEEVASSCSAIRFFQFYVTKRWDVTVHLVQRAERSGCKGIVLTVDTLRLGRLEADIKKKMISLQAKNFEGLLSTESSSKKGSNPEAVASEIFDDSLSWKDVSWLKFITNLPILIKGVLSAEGAAKAVEIGVAGVIVSNHGACQLDYVPATISALEEVVQAVRGKVPPGTDIFKALTLGAQAVFVSFFQLTV